MVEQFIKLAEGEKDGVGIDQFAGIFIETHSNAMRSVVPS